jgi:hypothetical protein
MMELFLIIRFEGAEGMRVSPIKIEVGPGDRFQSF